MNKVLKYVSILVIIFVLIIMIILLLGKDLQQVSVEKFELNGLENISGESVTIVGDLYINNPSKISVPIKQINYDVILEKNNITLSSGEIPSFILEKNIINKIPFSHNMKFKPSLDLLLQLLTQEEVYIVVSGKVYVDVAGIETYDVDFLQKVDFKEYLQKQIK
ncbi:hypothetical protein HZA96_06565 [Candidatus Woesearchaeota archaeon]|nr:hypothetical protein [Candidatus Woesearchaeota archaeon]